MISDSKWSKRIVLLVHLLGLLVLHQFTYIGHYGFDDMHYAQLANNLLHGVLNFSDHFTYRIVPIALTAIGFALFGINDFAATLPSLLASMLVLFLIYKIQKRQSKMTLGFSLSLCLLSPWYLAYSSKLMPDIFLCLFAFVALFYYHRSRFQVPEKRPIWNALGFAFSLFLAFNTKGTIILMVPVLSYLIIADLLSKRQIAFWKQAIVFGLLLLAVYFLSIEYLTGDFSTRFKALYSNTYLNRCSFDQQELPILLKRIFRDLFLLFHREVMLVSVLLLGTGFWSHNKKQLLNLSSESSFWFSTGLLVLLSSNFMSISLNSYNPMCLDARHYLFIVPILAIPASRILEEILCEGKHRLAFGVLSFLFIAVYFLDPHRYIWSVYFTFSLGVLLLSFFPKFKAWFPLFLLVFLSLPIVHQIQYAADVSYRQQRDVIQNEILSKLERGYVISDQVQTNLANYYQGFSVEPKLKFLSYEQAKNTNLNDRDIYILNNRHSKNLLFYEDQDLPFYARFRGKSDAIIFEDEGLGMELRKVNALIDPRKDLEILFESKLSFEDDSSEWQSDRNDWKSEPVYEGQTSCLVREYGPTLQLALDSLLQDHQSYYIQISAYAYTADASDARLVLSLENESGSWQYESTKINRYLSSYSAWWKIQLNALVQLDDLPPGSQLKVYVHNPDLNSIYVDNLALSIGKLP